MFKHNTIVSGRQDSSWTTSNPAANRFSADGHVQSASLNLFPSLPNPYDGTGTIWEDNIFLLSTRLGNVNYQKFDDPSAKWIARNNLIYVKSWNVGTFDPSNFIISDSIKSGALPTDFIDHQLFMGPNYTMGHTLTQAPNTAFDLTPQPGSILCTLSTTGGYIGAIPCASISKTIAAEIENPISVYPNPASTQITIGVPASSNFTLEMRNTLGELVLRSQNKSTLDISKCPNGMYFLKVMTGRKIWSVQVLKV